MPAGMSPAAYAKFAIACALSMAVGSQIVHHKYKPLSNLEEYIEREILSHPIEEQIKIRTAIQWKKDKTDEEIAVLPPDIQLKVKQALMKQ